MVKSLLTLSILCSLLISDALDNKIRSFMPSSEYQKHQRLIDKIFSNRTNYYTNGSVDTIKVIDTLKANGLLKLNLKSPSDINLQFDIDSPSFFALKAISDSLSAIGYNYFVIEDASSGEDGFFLTLSIDTKYAPDPALLGKELSSRGIGVGGVDRNGHFWNYTIKTTNPKLPDSKNITPGGSVELSDLYDSHWITLAGGGDMITIESLEGNTWYPYVVFYDRYLNILSIIEESDIISNKKLELPDNTYFIKVADAFSPSNVKNGFIITLN